MTPERFPYLAPLFAAGGYVAEPGSRPGDIDAIDSATEDLIQHAMRSIQKGRTTLLITHRISQIRWADRILVLRRGELAAQGTHEHLMRTSEVYRRIFARYERVEPGVRIQEPDVAPS